MPGGESVTFGSGAFSRTAQVLRSLDPKSTIAAAAGLFTVPELQATAVRLETLQHLACIYCAGKKQPRTQDLLRQLNVELADSLGQKPLRAMFTVPVPALLGGVPAVAPVPTPSLLAAAPTAPRQGDVESPTS